MHISKKIVAKHHGTIAVRSQPGHTRFSIWLPLKKKPVNNSKN